MSEQEIYEKKFGKPAQYKRGNKMINTSYFNDWLNKRRRDKSMELFHKEMENIEKIRKEKQKNFKPFVKKEYSVENWTDNIIERFDDNKRIVNKRNDKQIDNFIVKLFEYRFDLYPCQYYGYFGKSNEEYIQFKICTDCEYRENFSGDPCQYGCERSYNWQFVSEYKKEKIKEELMRRLK